jgi:hypothetical protein
MVRVGHDGADIVEHGAQDLLQMFGPFVEVANIGDVKVRCGFDAARRSGRCVPLGQRRASGRGEGLA